MRRLLSVVLILALLAGATGIPVFNGGPKDRSQPFPCQHHACGCASADECWHHCCCYTNREKLAWARQHGVTPPGYVVAAAEKEAEPAGRVCCRQAGCPNCAASSSQHVHDDGCDFGARRHKKGGRSRTVLVLTDLARQCRGLSSVWTLLVDALPFRAESVWSFDRTFVGRVIDSAESETSVELPPPDPPPKLRPICG